MKLEILKENLKAGLSVVERIVGRNLSLPVLNNVLLDTEDTFLVLTSTDLETAIRLWILTKIIKKGRAVVPAKFISSFVGTLSNEKITIEVKDQNIHIEGKNIKTSIQGHSPEEFPIIPEFKNVDVLEVDVAKFTQGLGQVIDIPIGSQSRPEISGIYISFSGNTIKLAATDSFRLGEKNITLDKPVKKNCSFILPQRPAREILNVLEGKEGNVKIYFSGNQALFEFPFKEIDHPQVQISSRLIDGEYPNYQDIIPTKFKANVVVRREEFLNQIKTASLFSGKVNEVKISTHPDKKELGIFARSQDVGENRASIAAMVEGEALEVSFNYKNLTDGLTHIKCPEVMFDISKEDGPCILRPVGDASYLYVVMPIKPM